MENISIIKTAWSYLKHHKGSIFVFCIFSVIFYVVFSLYNLQVEAVSYSVLLCICFGLILVIIDFIHYYNRHKMLTQLQKKITLSIEDLPLPKNLIEQDYIELIEIIHNDKVRLVSEENRCKSDMLEYYTLWAHQIKTPIAAMGLLLQSEENTQNKELTTELFKIEQYVEMVLSYLRMDSNSTDFIIKTYSLDSIVKQAVRKYAPQFIRKKISLDYTDLGCNVLTDEKWLVFVIEQVLSNALKYTQLGKISIYMKENKTLLIEDTGIGIAKEDLPRIFEKGFTGYNGRRDKKSTGIGLYLCKRILTKLSHTIKIESDIGKGTKVLIGLDIINIERE